jgi:glycine oxidase
LFYPDDAFVDPNDLLCALRRVCEAQAVSVYERQAVREVDSSDYTAVVVAAGAWSSQIQVKHRGKLLKLPEVIPVKGHLIGFQLGAGTLGSIRCRQPTYVVQRSNGFTIAGSNEEEAGFDRSVDAAICDDIHRRASELVPTLGDMTPVRRWIGFRPRSAGGTRPHIERMAGTNVWLAYGHYRNGILLAPLTAQRVSEEIVSYTE